MVVQYTVKISHVVKFISPIGRLPEPIILLKALDLLPENFFDDVTVEITSKEVDLSKSEPNKSALS
jgi:hypothetical protein